jgi:hypothetical protein
VADSQPAYLPNDDIVFTSTRCVQTAGAGGTQVRDLYTCGSDGRFLRRLGYNQADAVHPQVLDDGRILYTRWEHNDRGPILSQPLFQMNPDGTGQAEFYGNDPRFPFAMTQARGIPGTQKVLAVLDGPRGRLPGPLAMIDPAKGRRVDDGLRVIGAGPKVLAARLDSASPSYGLWQHPCPLNDKECLVAYAPVGWSRATPGQGDADFGICWMDLEGRRELLASDPRWSCQQPVPLAPRPRPWRRANRVDYYQPGAIFYLQDIYAGPGLAGVPRGTIKKLRVVALDYRAAAVGHNFSRGPAGEALVSTPVAVGNAAWDVKFVLGEATVYEDGSALFSVPARVPVYFQALDARGCAVQTMRSWSTLQPGEYASCVGCHEHKNTSARTRDYGFSLAMKAGTQLPAEFHGPPRGFSFPQEIQPILDRHCIRCHKDRAPVQELVRGRGRPPLLDRPPVAVNPANASPDEPAFSLLGEGTVDLAAKRKWSDAYLVLTQSAPEPSAGAGGAFQGACDGRLVNWISSQSGPGPLPPYSVGAARSELLTLLEQGHKAVKLSREELEKIACWIDLLAPYCGDYLEANAWTAEELKTYQRAADQRRRMEEADLESIRELLGVKTDGRRPAPLGPMRMR